MNTEGEKLVADLAAALQNVPEGYRDTFIGGAQNGAWCGIISEEVAWCDWSPSDGGTLRIGYRNSPHQTHATGIPSAEAIRIWTGIVKAREASR